MRAWLGTNGQTFFKRLDPKKVSIVKAWSLQTIRFIRSVSPSVQASDASFIAPVPPVSERNRRVSEKANKDKISSDEKIYGLNPFDAKTNCCW